VVLILLVDDSAAKGRCLRSSKAAPGHRSLW
jgi:hypothetical protein